MSDEMLQYYKKYYEADTPHKYIMGEVGQTSRVLQLVEWLRESTKAGDKVLDVGCGDMHLSTLLSDRDWYGIDTNVVKAKGKSTEHDLMETPYPFEANTFDVVVCSEVLEHLWDMRVVHKEVYRLLKPKGKYLVSTPNHDWIDNTLSNYKAIIFDADRPWTLEHIRTYDPECHEHYLRLAGFDVLDITGADAHYGSFFKHPRSVLKRSLPALSDGDIDRVLGRMFPLTSHTIMMKAVKI